MSSSFSFKHIATKVKKNGRYGVMFFDFQTKTPVSIILYACCTQTPWFVWTNPKKAWKQSLIVNFHKFIVIP